MTKAVEAIVMFTLFIFVFFAGVNYSDSIKSRAGWLFEGNEEEVALPDTLNSGTRNIVRDSGSNTIPSSDQAPEVDLEPEAINQDQDQKQ